MALSSFSSRETPPQFFDTEMTSNCFHQRIDAELLAAGDFLQYYQSDNSNLPNNFLDFPWYDPYHLLSLENHEITTTDDHLLLPNLSSPCAPDIFPQHDVHPNPYPKRQKCFQDRFYPDFPPTFSNVFAPNSYSLPEFLPIPGVYPTPFLKFEQLPEASIDNTISNVNDHENVNIAKNKVEEKGASPQSVAARERRRKITEKTQVLGTLVPGGSKMNTAEMLTAAYNYVKFLQAQVGILELMGSFQEMMGSPPEELQVVAFPIIQEKLYSENNCLVPMKFVEILAKHFDAQSNPSLSNNLNQLLTSSD